MSIMSSNTQKPFWHQPTRKDSSQIDALVPNQVGRLGACGSPHMNHILRNLEICDLSRSLSSTCIKGWHGEITKACILLLCSMLII